jgi:hypothetical protein
MSARRNNLRRHPRVTASPLSLEVRAGFGEPRRMAARTSLSSFEARKSAHLRMTAVAVRTVRNDGEA